MSYQKNVAKLSHLASLSIFASLNSLEAKAKQAPVDLPNFHVVHSYLLRGGQPSSNGLKALKDMGVDAIVDLRAQSPLTREEAAQAAKLGMKYENLPMSNNAPTEKQVKTFLETVDNQAALAKESQASGLNKYPHSVFVHCAHGSDRTGCMVGIWRVSRDYWTFPQTYKEMRQYYFGPQYTELSKAVERRAKRSQSPQPSQN
jgi:protein tyrosine/serine phosphatase